MKKFGASDQLIKEKLGIDETKELEVIHIEIHSDNWDACQVFQYCHPEMFAGMTSFVWTGIKASEIYAACRLLLVKRADWPQILEDVNYMGIYSARLNNRSKGSKR